MVNDESKMVSDVTRNGQISAHGQSISCTRLVTYIILTYPRLVRYPSQTVKGPITDWSHAVHIPVVLLNMQSVTQVVNYIGCFNINHIYI